MRAFGRRPLRSILLLAIVLAPAAIVAARSSDEPERGWTHAASMPVPKDEFAIAVVDGRIHAIGGITGPEATPLSDHQMFDPQAGRWVGQPPLPVARGAVRAAVVGDDIYVIGGSTRVDVFDTATGTWSQRAPMPDPVLVPGLAVIDGSIYVLGGFQSSGPRGGVPVDSVLRYDIEADAWTELAPMPMKRSHHAVVALDGRIYVMGGNDAGPLAVVQTYDPRTDSWSLAEPLPEPMQNFGAAVWNGQIHALVHSSHYVYDPGSREWTAARPMTVPRHGFGAAVLDGNLYVIGGCYEEPRYDTPTNEVLPLAVGSGSPGLSPARIAAYLAAPLLLVAGFRARSLRHDRVLEAAVRTPAVHDAR